MTKIYSKWQKLCLYCTLKLKNEDLESYFPPLFIQKSQSPPLSPKSNQLREFKIPAKSQPITIQWNHFWPSHNHFPYQSSPSYFHFFPSSVQSYLVIMKDYWEIVGWLGIFLYFVQYWLGNVWRSVGYLYL